MTVFNVTATSQGVIRTERIDTATNSVFSPNDSAAEVRRKYERFWRIGGGPKVKVLKVEEETPLSGFSKENFSDVLRGLGF